MLKINWNMELPSIDAKQWHTWQDLNIPSKNYSHLSEISSKTLKAILDKAFSLSLSRFCGWDLSHIEKNQLRPYLLAAKIYKRGVPTKTLTNKTKKQFEAGQYEIKFLEKNEPILNKAFKDSFNVIDSKLLERWPELYAQKSFSLQPSELEKNLVTVIKLCEAWKKNGKKKHWNIIGGGIVSDTAAFSAALMGCAFTLYPSTLLAMVDACVGGKTGVNAFPYGKNQLGLFSFPEMVCINPGFLHTLERREILAGGAECLKHCFLKDDKVQAAKVAEAISENHLETLSELLPELILCKANIINKDPGEKGERAILNLGHTLAHALEAISNESEKSKNKIAHGEAVGIGLYFSIFFSNRLNHLKKQTYNEMLECLKKSCILLPKKEIGILLGLALDSPKLGEKLMFYLRKDKKNTSRVESSISWVLLEDWGKTVINSDGGFTVKKSMEEFLKFWKNFCEDYHHIL